MAGPAGDSRARLVHGMKVLVPDGFPRGGLPDDVDLSARRHGAEFAVPTSSEMAEGLGGLPDLRVVQVLSAGIDWVEPHVPDGVTLCNAGDTRSPAVAQWVVAAILHDLSGFQRAEARGGASRSAGSRASWPASAS